MAVERICEVCGHHDLMPRSRKFCSRRCQMLESRARRGQRCAAVLVCTACDELFSVAATHGDRKPRSDHRYCDRCSRLRTLRMVSSGAIPLAQALALGTTCGICSDTVDLMRMKPDPLAPSIDHIVPQRLGGSDAINNLQMTHAACNRRKHLRSAADDFGLRDRQRFYSLRRWRRLSVAVRVDEPTCRTCGKQSVCVDHILGIEEGGDQGARSNLQALCLRCHLRKSQAEYRARWKP
jgi:5-methylcytosine-specific restriction endonuclease McrA